MVAFRPRTATIHPKRGYGALVAYHGIWDPYLGPHLGAPFGAIWDTPERGVDGLTVGKMTSRVVHFRVLKRSMTLDPGSDGVGHFMPNMVKSTGSDPF